MTTHYLLGPDVEKRPFAVLCHGILDEPVAIIEAKASFASV